MSGMDEVPQAKVGELGTDLASLANMELATLFVEEHGSVPAEEIVGTHANKVMASTYLPGLGSIKAVTHRQSYRRGDAIPVGWRQATPPDCDLVPAHLTMTLKTAYEKFGGRLLAFERIYAIRHVVVAGFEIRREVNLNVLLLVHRG